MEASYDGLNYKTDDEVFRSHIERGLSEPYPRHLAIVQRYLRQFPHLNRCCVDVGAHIGTTMLPYARLFDRVVGFEANSKNFGFLTENLVANPAEGVKCTIHYKAVSHVSGKRVRSEAHSSANSGCYLVCEDDEGEVVTCTLDEQIGTDQRVDFLKIDIEGSELRVLQGAQKMLERDGPLIQVEVNECGVTYFGITGFDIESFLTGLGYRLYNNSDTSNLFYYRPSSALTVASRTIFCCWTDHAPMSPARLAAFESLQSATEDCRLVLVTPTTLHDWILQTEPLPKVYSRLSATHRADFLRCYLMHFYGGGYSDIKPYQAKLGDTEWAIAFVDLEAHTQWLFNGSPEIDGGSPCPHLRPLERTHLVGNCAFIMKPHTKYTRKWYRAVTKCLQLHHSSIWANRATGPQDCWNDQGQRPTTSYPLGWAELLGCIVHPLQAQFASLTFGRTVPSPICENYR
jgi:FkbM family methyltransferase